MADPPLYILHSPHCSSLSQKCPVCFLGLSLLRLSSPGLSDGAAPLVSPTEGHLCVVIELSLCLLFDKINSLSPCVLSNLKDHHWQLPGLDKVSQFSALIPALVVVCFTAPGPDLPELSVKLLQN